MQIKAEIKGEIAEDVHYEFTNANRGLSMYEIAERLDWNAEDVYNFMGVRLRGFESLFYLNIPR